MMALLPWRCVVCLGRVLRRQVPHRLVPRSSLGLLSQNPSCDLLNNAPHATLLIGSPRGLHTTTIDHVVKRTKDDGRRIRLFGQHDEDLGTMRKSEAEHLADEKRLKLVIIDDTRGQYQVTYRLMTGVQLMAEQRALRLLKRSMKPKEQKTLRVSSSIGDHDLTIKNRHLLEWVEKGHEVKVVIKKSRHEKPEAGATVLQKLTDTVKGLATVKQSKSTGEGLVFLLKPVAAPDSGDKPPPLKLDEMKKSAEN